MKQEMTTLIMKSSVSKYEFIQVLCEGVVVKVNMHFSRGAKVNTISLLV
jgi:hypothetical protein